MLYEETSVRQDSEGDQEEGEVDYEPLSEEETPTVETRGRTSTAAPSVQKAPPVAKAATPAVAVGPTRRKVSAAAPAPTPSVDSAQRQTRVPTARHASASSSSGSGPQGSAGTSVGVSKGVISSVPLANSLQSSGLHHVTMFTQVPTIELMKDLT